MNDEDRREIVSSTRREGEIGIIVTWICGGRLSIPVSRIVGLLAIVQRMIQLGG